jgi:hypothetical protein
MSLGMRNLKDIFIKEGKKTLNLLLSSDRITIYEKIDALNFSFTVNEEELEFFKKNKTSFIGSVERTLTSMYEKPIEHFNSLLFDLEKHLGYTFGFYYFPDYNPNIIKYTTLPKNNLILAYVEDEKGNKIDDLETLELFASLLEVGNPPILFDGKFTSEQISDLYSYVESTEEEIEKEYKGLSFTEYMFQVLNINKENSTIKDISKEQIEGLIFRFGDLEGNYTYTKLMNPWFEEIVKQNKKKEGLDHNYYLILSDIVDYLMTINISNIRLTKQNYEDRYVELISKMFNKFVKYKGDDYLELEIHLPEYLQKDFNNLNLDRIKNKKTLEYVLGSVNLKEIFRIFLASFRKKRRGENFIFTKRMNKFFNEIVDEISDKVTFDELLSESFITFDEYQKIFIDNVPSEEVIGINLNSYLRKQPAYIKDYVETSFNINDFMSSAFVEVEKRKTKRDDRKKAMMIIDTFDPMNELVYEMCLYIYEQTEIPIFLVATYPRQSHYTDEILEKIFNDMVNSHEAFENYIFIDRPNIKKIIDAYGDEYRFEKIYANNKFQKFIDVQLEMNYRDNNHLLLPAKHEDVYDYYQSDKSLIVAADRALEQTSFTQFKQHVPDNYANLFNEISAEYQKNKKK